MNISFLQNIRLFLCNVILYFFLTALSRAMLHYFRMITLLALGFFTFDSLLHAGNPPPAQVQEEDYDDDEDDEDVLILEEDVDEDEPQN